MGLNLDIKHVAFSGIKKFDGRHFRQLLPNEIAQIAGRAGRNQINGSFGITGELTDLDAKIVDAIENHSFSTLKRLFWRNDKLEFSNVIELIESLEKTPNNNNLTKAREADDIIALKHFINSNTNIIYIYKISVTINIRYLFLFFNFFNYIWNKMTFFLQMMSEIKNSCHSYFKIKSIVIFADKILYQFF